jgi:DNA-binding NtrC family response regulator
MKRPPPVRASSLSATQKRVLLVVTHSPKNNLRANVLRKHGMDVICANHIGDARMLWHPNTYDLVLFDLRHENGAAEELCGEIRTESPHQLVAFLVGKPEYLSAIPSVQPVILDEAPKRYEQTLRQLMATACEALPQRGGFLEATWRMGLARAVKPTPIADAPRPVVHQLTSLPEAVVTFSFGEAVRQAESTSEEIAP